MAARRGTLFDRWLWTILPGATLLSISLGQVLAAAAVARWVASGRRWPAGLRLPLLIFLGWTAASALTADRPPESLRDGAGKWAFALLLPAAWAHGRTGTGMRGPVAGYLSGVLVALPVALRTFLSGDTGRAEAFSGGGPHLGSNVMMGLVIAIAVAAASPAFRARASALAAGLAALLALTLNRAALLGAAAGTAVTLARVRPALLACGLLAAAGMFAAWPESRPVLRLRAGLLYPVDRTARERALMWSAGLRMVRDRPILGVGGRRSFIRAYESGYRSPDSRESEPGHVHQSFIQTAVQHGVPGLGLLGWWLAVLLRHAFRPAARPIAVPLLSAVLVNASFDFVLADGQHALMWYALAGLTLGSAASAPPQRRR